MASPIQVVDFASAGTYSTPLANSACVWNSLSAPNGNYLAIAWALANDGDTITPPSSGASWTAAYVNTGSAGNSFTSTGLWWKYTASTGESATQIWTTSSSGHNLAVGMVLIAGFDPNTNPQFSTIASQQTGATLTTNTLTPVNIGDLILGFFAGSSAVSALSVSSSPAYTQICVGQSGSSGWKVLCEQQTALAANNTTALSVSSTATYTTLSALTGFLVTVPTGTRNITNSDTIATLSDTVAAFGIGRYININDVGPNPYDTLGITEIIPIVINDTGPAVSDGLDLSDFFFAFTESISALSDSVSISFALNLTLVDTLANGFVYDEIIADIIGGTTNNWWQQLYPFGQS